MEEEENKIPMVLSVKSLKTQNRKTFVIEQVERKSEKAAVL